MENDSERRRDHKRSPGVKLSAFEQAYHSFQVGELKRPNEDGSETILRAYELIVHPMDAQERRGLLARFGLRAAAAGYSQALGPVTLPSVGYGDAQGDRPLTALYFFLETP